MSLIVENAYFFIYSSAALFILTIAVCWGNDHKINAASLLLASIILTNIFFRLVVIHAMTPQLLNLIYGLMDLFLLWVFLGIARKPAAYERNYWAAALALIHFFMMSVNLFGSSHEAFTRAPLFMIVLNGLVITALVTCLISFMPKSWDEATGVLRVKWLYFKADIFDRLLRISPKKTAASGTEDGQGSIAGALNIKIAERIREARLKRGLDEEALGAFLGARTSEAHMLETGKRRLSASALYALAKHLGTKMNIFHQGLGVAAPSFAQTRPARN